jgi:hypothetical protein
MSVQAPTLRAAVAAAIVVGATFGSPAFAAPTAADKESARALALKGDQQFEAGDCKGATESFQQAERLVHSPIHLLYIARCKAKTGRLLEARKIFKEILAETLPPDASAPYKEAFNAAQNGARGEVVDADVRLPTIELVFGAGAAGAAVTIDGTPVAAADLDRPIQLDPGVHTVVATREGARFERTITLKDGGGSQKVEVVLTGAKGTKGTNLVPVVVSFGVGALGLGVGAVTGLMSLGKVRDLETQCPTKRCSPALEDTADSAKTLGTVSTIGFVVGGVGAAAGAALLLFRPVDQKDEKDAGARVRVGLGPGSVFVGGAF